MSDIPGKSKFDEYVKLGLVRSQVHPNLPLTIYNYTEFTSFERLWNNITKLSRGLVINDKDRCIVRCMTKFFNEDEPYALCGIDNNLNSVVFNKLDGSLIQIVNDFEYGLIITSRGSFTSDHVNWAKSIINEKYNIDDFDKNKTYIFELIWPENRIVVDYGEEKEIYLIAVIETNTGEEYDIYSDKFSKFKKVETIKDINKHMSNLSIEGIVVKTGNHRYKVKTGEYLRLHRIVTNFTEKRIWESMLNNESLEFTNMPEEFEKWLNETIYNIKVKYNLTESLIMSEYENTKHLTNKEIGLSRDIKYKSFIFMIRNGKDIRESIYKLIKPKNEIKEINAE